MWRQLNILPETLEDVHIAQSESQCSLHLNFDDMSPVALVQRCSSSAVSGRVITTIGDSDDQSCALRRLTDLAIRRIDLARACNLEGASGYSPRSATADVGPAL